MTERRLHETCAAFCRGQVQFGPPRTAEDVCGEISGRITRQDSRFHELRGLHGDLLKFPSEQKCADDSTDKKNLCSDRLVSARMATPLSKLGKLVQSEWQGEHLKVVEAWKEHPDGQDNPSSLHYEGRAAVVNVDISGDDVIKRLAELAVCSGFDYVRILETTDQVEVAVKGPGDPEMVDEEDILSKQMFDEAMNTADANDSSTECLEIEQLLNVGDTYPSGQWSENDVCGPLERPLYRADQNDMKRLYYYAFNDVEFTNEKGGTWCGVETRLCISCDAVNSTASWDWCSTRMMTPRLAIGLRIMAQTAGADGIEIKVLNGYLEDNEWTGHTDNISDLYRAGRGIMLTTTNENDTGKLAQHAICAGIDYVRYTNETYIEVFVLPQSDYQGKLVYDIDDQTYFEVNPPTTLNDDYKYPSILNDEDVKPLLIDGHNDQYTVYEYYKLADVKDPSNRYLRFDNGLLECLELVSDDFGTVVNIVHGSAYRTRSTNQINIDTRHSEEKWRFEAGQAVEIKPGKTTSDQALVRLATSIFRSCTTFLRLDLRGIGLGCHFDRLYLDVRPLIDGSEMEFITLWNADNTTYFDEIKMLKDALQKGGPAIAPINIGSTCNNIPLGEHMTYINFQFGQIESCAVKSRKDFCNKSRSAREKEVLQLQQRMTDTAGFDRLPRKEIIPDIEACLLHLCGGCPGAGLVWDEKIKACAPMIHKYIDKAARPFPELRNKASFFNTASPVSSVHSLACHDGNVCVESVQLHSILMPLVTSRFRPNATSSLEFMLFSSEQNPTPVLELVEQEMAYKASGKVNVFIEEDNDVSSLRQVLKVLMAYNKNVTEVEFHVAAKLDEDLVGSAIQRKIDVWSKNTCPNWSRFAIVPYTIHTIHPSRQKRSLKRSKSRNEARSRIHDWEMEWLIKLI
ncbi:uncharacterized protein LOC121390613 [Gigantopelta aegis]|uniref:uncharacterized protein LOC121390613 n=1 Tax=Gigantopelta aegis TaxID=1735272 RepID=UPI001B8890B7|nr:uncharacterized protein LOC121390613 [Gigantopelta aegis]